MATDAETALVQENIEEYVNDENKIVTSRWLSLTLNLNINVAKRALYTFVEHERNKGGNDDINVTYFVAGLGKTKSGANEHKCVVVPESDLEAVKKSLSVVTSCHIYSVQRAKLKDYTPLYMTDFDIIKNNLDKCSSNSSIRCPWVAVNKTGKQSGKVSQKQVEDVKQQEPTPKATPSAPSSSTAKSSTSKKPEPKGSIASMFATASKKGGGDGKSAAESTKPEKKDTSPPKAKQNDKKGKGMLAFIGTGSSTNKKAAENTSNKGAKSSDRVPEKEKHIPKAKAEVEEDDEPSGKRRRRIRTDLFDSSDEEDEDVAVEEEEENALEEAMMEEQNSPAPLQPDGNEDDEEKKVDSPAKSPKKEVSPEKHVNGTGRKRKRAMKVVSKQYLDEDGFMVTKKETEWVSGSDNSDVEETTAPQPEKKVANTEPANAKPANKAPGKTEPKGKAASKKPAASPQKGKQTSLMSFFKKK